MVLRLIVSFTLIGQVLALFDFTSCGLNGKTCVLSPTDCDSNPSTCQQGLSFKRMSASFLEVELFSNKLPTTAPYDSYMAIGFQGAECSDLEKNSKMACMASTPVMECSALNGQLMAPAVSWNNDSPKNVRIDNAADLATAVSLSMSALESSNGQTYCRISQRITGAPLNGIPNADHVFQYDPSKQYALIMAVGSTKNGALSKHGHGETMVSTKRYSFS